MDDAASEQYDRAVAYERNLRQFRGEQQHRRTRRGKFTNQSVDLPLGADVDAASRVEAQQRLEFAGQPARDHHLLLIATAQALQRRLGTGVDLQSANRLLDALSLGAHVNQTPMAQATIGRQRHILADRALRQHRLLPVGGHQNQACADRVGGMSEILRTATHDDLAAIALANAGDAIEQFLLALPFQGRDAEYLAGVQGERDVVEQTAAAQASHLERRRHAACRLGSEASAAGGSGVSHFVAKHELDDTLFAAAGGVGDADGEPVAQHGGAITQCRYLGHAMGNEDHAATTLAPAPYYAEDALREIGRQRRSYLVDQQDGGSDANARARSIRRRTG